MDNIKVRNFSLYEVIHRLKDFPQSKLPIAHIALGYVQSLRDAASIFFNKDVPIIILSGYRSPDYNRMIGGAENSYHTWRIDDKDNAVFALDLSPVGVSLEEFFVFAKNYVKGEVYMHETRRLVHIAPYGKDEDFVIS